MDTVTVIAWMFVAATLACVALWVLIAVMLLVEIILGVCQLMRRKA